MAFLHRFYCKEYPTCALVWDKEDQNNSSETSFYTAAHVDMVVHFKKDRIRKTMSQYSQRLTIESINKNKSLTSFFLKTMYSNLIRLKRVLRVMSEFGSLRDYCVLRSVLSVIYPSVSRWNEALNQIQTQRLCS